MAERGIEAVEMQRQGGGESRKEEQAEKRRERDRKREKTGAIPCECAPACHVVHQAQGCSATRQLYRL
eukprot:355892-Chlamydomonas_euryale.AAC.8